MNERKEFFKFEQVGTALNMVTYLGVIEAPNGFAILTNEFLVGLTDGLKKMFKRAVNEGLMKGNKISIALVEIEHLKSGNSFYHFDLVIHDTGRCYSTTDYIEVDINRI